MILWVANQPGTLLAVLTEFAARGINLTRLESRPTRATLGEYVFLVDADGHITDPAVADVLGALIRREVLLRYLGSYPRMRGRSVAPPAFAAVPGGMTPPRLRRGVGRRWPALRASRRVGAMGEPAMRLILIRHGQTPSNVLGTAGHRAARARTLTDLGRRTGRGDPGGRSPANGSTPMFASNLTRARLTAAPLARARGLRSAGPRAGSGRSPPATWRCAAMPGGGPCLPRRRRGMARRPGGYPDAGARRRVGSGGVGPLRLRGGRGRSAVPADGTAVLVSHGAAIRIWAAARSDNLPEQLRRLQQPAQHRGGRY